MEIITIVNIIIKRRRRRQGRRGDQEVRFKVHSLARAASVARSTPVVNPRKARFFSHIHSHPLSLTNARLILMLNNVEIHYYDFELLTPICC